MSTIEKYIDFKNVPIDIIMFFQNKIKEKYLLNEIFGYLDYILFDYINYRKKNKDEEYYKQIVKSTMAIAKHNIKYKFNKFSKNSPNFNDLIWFSHYYIKSDLNKMSFGRYMNILNYFSLKRYNIGDRFNIYIGGVCVHFITLTTQNKNSLFTFIENKIPAILIGLAFHQIEIESNRPLNKRIDVFGCRLQRELDLHLVNPMSFQIDNNVINGKTKHYIYTSGMGCLTYL